MKAAWLETVFSIATPVLFLVSGLVSGRPADDLFPFGYHRWVSIAFLCAALALFGLGIYLVADAVGKLTGDGQAAERSEERRGGKECGSTCRSRWTAEP